MHLFRGTSPKCVLTPQKETSSHIFKMTIFSKWDIFRQNAGKKKNELWKRYYYLLNRNGVYSWLKSLGLNNSWLKSPRSKLGVEKSRVEMSFNLGKAFLFTMKWESKPKRQNLVLNLATVDKISQTFGYMIKQSITRSLKI